MDPISRIRKAKSDGLIELNLSGLGLNQVPKEIAELEKITSLDLSSNSISSLSKEVTGLTNLKRLDLSDNILTELPPELIDLNKLELLILSNNKFYSFPVNVFNLNNLAFLSYRGNQLKVIPNEIKFSKLVYLDLSKNKISNIRSVEFPENIRGLNLSANNIRFLPKQIFKLEKLERLSLNLNNISRIPKSIMNLENLKELAVYSNNLSSIPKEILELKNLVYIDFWNNPIDKFPIFLTELKNLIRLEFGENNFSEVPPEISKLSNLKQLSIWGGKLSSIPKSIFSLTNLVDLDLKNNNIEEIPAEIVNLKQLEVLNINNNRFCEFPKSIMIIKNLRELRLRQNSICKIPKEIIRLTQLKVFDLGQNKINRLTQNLFKLVNLKELYLDKNKISKLHNIDKLVNLTKLNISYNKITNIPESITSIENLEEFELLNNPLQSPPLEIAYQGIDAIRNYFESLKESLKEKLYEAKLIIVGEGGVGKTCLAKKLIDNNYTLCDESTTEGIDIRKWVLEIDKSNKNYDFSVNIWDFGGQEIYHSTHQFFLTKRSLYIFVWEARKEENYAAFHYWFNVIKLLSDNSPVLIVLNKTDERIKEIDGASYKEKFNGIRGFYQVSCITGKGIINLTNDIKRIIMSLPHIGTEWPDSWTKIRRRLEADFRDYIDYTEYLSICFNNGLDVEKANYLSSYLHDLGVILHFQSDPLLKNLVILKPEWGTNAVYKVLDRKEIQANKGKFEREFLGLIWDSEIYPAEKHDMLLQLMTKFELCFKLIDTDTYIIPEHLSSEKPIFDWNYNNNLKFEYHYDFIPAGIITRFIVRNSELIDSNNYWRNGVVLNYDGTRGLIISEALNRKIKITIDGVQKRELLAIIRKEFNKIHMSLNQPEVKEMIPCICKDCSSGKTYFFSYETVIRRLSKGKKIISCDYSIEDISIEHLLEGVFIEESLFNTKLGGGHVLVKIDNMAINGGQNVFAETIHDSQINYNETERKVIDFINKYSANDIEKESLMKEYIKLKEPSTESEEKQTCFNKIRTFFIKHGNGIADSLTAGLLIELSKLIVK